MTFPEHSIYMCVFVILLVWSCDLYIIWALCVTFLTDISKIEFSNYKYINLSIMTDIINVQEALTLLTDDVIVFIEIIESRIIFDHITSVSQRSSSILIS